MRVTRDGRVFVTHRGRPVVTLAGAEAARLIARAEGADEAALQQLLAKATGNFPRGNKARGRG